MKISEFPLHRAVENNDFQLLQSLLKSPTINPNAKNTEGITALMLAKKLGNDKMVDWFLQLHDAVLHTDHERLKSSLKIIHPNIQDEQGCIALLWAARWNDVKIIRSLLEDSRTNPNIQTKDGLTALIQASHSGRINAVQLLLNDERVEVDIQDKDERTALIWAAMQGQTAVVNLLLKHPKINLHAVDKNTNIALVYAVNSGKPEIIKAFIEKEAFSDMNNPRVCESFLKLIKGDNKDLTKDVVMKAYNDFNLSALKKMQYIARLSKDVVMKAYNDFNLSALKKMQYLARLYEDLNQMTEHAIKAIHSENLKVYNSILDQDDLTKITELVQHDQRRELYEILIADLLKENSKVSKEFKQASKDKQDTLINFFKSTYFYDQSISAVISMLLEACQDWQKFQQEVLGDAQKTQTEQQQEGQIIEQDHIQEGGALLNQSADQ